MELVGRRYDTFEAVSIKIKGDKISSIDLLPDSEAAGLPFIAPSMFDLQINGHGGIWFNKPDLTSDEVCQVLEKHYQYGITRLCPTLITSSYEAYVSGFSAIRQACEENEWVEQMVPGCHLEGPFISPIQGPRGAHPLDQVRAADWDEFCRLQELSGNRIRLITLAPEVDNAIPFIKKAVASGVVVSIGHTAAEPEQITEAVDAGARLSTHLGNGAHGTLRRHPNYIWEQLGEPRLMASIITDGHHLPASVVRTIIKTKGVENVIITCDASGLAGSPPGIYDEGSVKMEVLEDGPIVIAGQRQLLAGSGLETDTCVTTAIDMAGISLQEALDMAGLNPARLLGFEEIKLEVGSRADLILFHYEGAGSRMNIQTTLSCGSVKYGTLLVNS
ncbi:N-acetylglucosamine-6-phosphate deacetylase [Gimesia panareensis]|uniref:N-acetylglucosamine-6-phosphate deacetylase n=1 Tax=Gimesia panareensis TaxID=2527978 RepID=A0A517QBM6_9PLAN|nr:amidohydrolase family protein [Gimesia panareensis]QDT29040.1 N-acetylglucosamine-6-phosphate deacetylase [Gimesia panareensis]